MNKKLLFLIVLAGLVFSSSFVLAEPVVLTNPLGADNFCELFTSIANTIAVLIGALGTIMIIVSAIFYLTSAGSPEKMARAKATLIYAIVGIAIGVSAGTIVAIIKEVISAGGGTC